MVKQADVCMLNGLYQQRNMKMKEDEGTLISELLTITALLDGKMERREVYESQGRKYKKIVIEYDSTEWERNEV
tara:strand:+ start:215 stop:436 length:222 start_codon:yes stop_codon:yes gene_type:complete